MLRSTKTYKIYSASYYKKAQKDALINNRELLERVMKYTSKKIMFNLNSLFYITNKTARRVFCETLRRRFI